MALLLRCRRSGTATLLLVTLLSAPLASCANRQEANARAAEVTVSVETQIVRGLQTYEQVLDARCRAGRYEKATCDTLLGTLLADVTDLAAEINLQLRKGVLLTDLATPVARFRDKLQALRASVVKLIQDAPELLLAELNRSLAAVEGGEP